MAKTLRLDTNNYGPNGTIDLTRGDDWRLTGKIVNVNGPLLEDVDLTGTDAVSGFLPGDTAPIMCQVTILDADCGKVAISLAASGTSGAQLSDSGTGLYIVLQDAQGLHTINSLDQSIRISDRAFFQC